MAVGNSHRSASILSCPRFVVVCFGADAVRIEETVINGCRTLFINPANEASVAGAIVALKTAVDLLVRIVTLELVTRPTKPASVPSPSIVPFTVTDDWQFSMVAVPLMTCATRPVAYI